MSGSHEIVITLNQFRHLLPREPFGAVLFRSIRRHLICDPISMMSLFSYRMTANKQEVHDALLSRGSRLEP